MFMIRNFLGIAGDAWDHSYSTRDQAAEALRLAVGWPAVVLGEPFDGADGVCSWPAHETQQDADDDVGNAPLVVCYPE
jgi:hypothetical protein